MSQNKQQTSSEIGYNGFYLERSGEHASELVDVLMSPPELPLFDVERQEVYDFEKRLAGEQVTEDATIEQVIRGAFGEDVVAPMFFVQPFIDGKVSVKGLNLPSYQSEGEVYRSIALAVKEKLITPAQLRAISKESTAQYVASVEDALTHNYEVTDEDTAAHSFVIEPEKFIDYAYSVIEARSALHQYRKMYKEGGERMDGARRAVVDVYLARINEILAQTIPRADYLIAQSMLVGDADMTKRAALVIPSGLRDAVLDFRTHRDVLKRLDYLRNGVATGENGTYTAVDDETLGEEADIANETHEERAPMFTPEQRAILQATMIQPEDMLSVMTRVVDRAGLLSEEDPSTWVPDRKYRAKDGLFQVVTNPGQATFAVDGISGVYKVASQPRSLYEFLTVGGFHEPKHIDQAQADRRLGECLKIAELKGKRVSMIREAGANSEQRRAEKEYFGTEKPFASTYARALKALEDGKGVAVAIETFYDEKRRIAPDVTASKAAREAADRVVRLVRQGGLSSQPLVYAEEAILDKELASASPEKRARATAITGLDLVDQARLHKYGLLPEAKTEYIDWPRYVLEELQPYISAALQEAGENV